MSKENLEQFISKVADSEELQAKIGEEIDAEALIALAADYGVNVLTTWPDWMEHAESDDAVFQWMHQFVLRYFPLRGSSEFILARDIVFAWQRIILSGYSRTSYE